MKLNINALFTKKERARIGSTLSKAKWGVVSVKFAALPKRNFLYETFSNKFLRSHYSSFCEQQVAKNYKTRPLYQRLTKNLMTFAGRNRIFALKRFRNSSSQMFCKIGLLKNFKEHSRKHLCLSHFLMLFPVN